MIRQAYRPAIWPGLALILAVTGVLRLVFWDWSLAHWWLAQGINVAISLAIVLVRWALWTRRHPVLPPEEWMDALRRAAPYN